MLSHVDTGNNNYFQIYKKNMTDTIDSDNKIKLRFADGKMLLVHPIFLQSWGDYGNIVIL